MDTEQVSTLEQAHSNNTGTLQENVKTNTNAPTKSNKIRVLVRIRPPRVTKDKVPLMSVTPIGGNQGIEVRKWKNNGQRSESGKGFRFDRVFPPETSQDDIFSNVRYMSERLIKGFNGAVIAYVLHALLSLYPFRTPFLFTGTDRPVRERHIRLVECKDE